LHCGRWRETSLTKRALLLSSCSIHYLCFVVVLLHSGAETTNLRMR
jgi:hypothetical protein